MRMVDTYAEQKKGLSFRRYFTKAGENPLEKLVYKKISVNVESRKDKSTLFHMDNVEVPNSWSQLAADILAEKYFKKTGVGSPNGSEHSAKQVVYRVSHTIREFGEAKGYFRSREDADIFEDELTHILINQKGAFNSPVWFNCGVYHQYGIKDEFDETKDKGNWAYDFDTSEIIRADAYSRPQSSACFIQAAEDSLMPIFELIKNEARLFKKGSGTGSNYSNIRGSGETLSQGGTSSGLMSFLKASDAAAGATKSGGTTRRAAKMIILNVDHPEIEEFITLKSREEKKAHVLIAAGYSSDFEGEAYQTVTGQNANNSIRVTDNFMQAVYDNGKWQTTARTTGKVWKEYNARDIWELFITANYESGDPGIQFHDTINKMNPCKNSGEIKASNPCSEYMFLDDTACNLASINLLKFLNEDWTFDIEGYRHACELFITAQEILVDLSSYPTKKITQNSHDYRPLGLGYANLGALLMNMGLPYDSEEALTITGSLTAIMTGRAYAQSARLASNIGAFQKYAENKKCFLDVINKHRDAVKGIKNKDGLKYLIEAAQEDWDIALKLGEEHGYRNAQSTVIAPTGTIALLMDCDTTGIEPDYSLVKYKKLAGGGITKIINQSVPNTLAKLGYNNEEVAAISNYVSENNSVEGAPFLRKEQYVIFDCANKSLKGTRFISPMTHVNIMAAAQPFVSGAISKTVNFPKDATKDDITEIYKAAHKLGVKAMAIYRDGSKESQPLNTNNLEKKVAERRELPTVRNSMGHKVKIAGVTVHLRVGEYDDGTFGEFFVDMFWKHSITKNRL